LNDDDRTMREEGEHTPLGLQMIRDFQEVIAAIDSDAREGAVPGGGPEAMDDVRDHLRRQLDEAYKQVKHHETAPPRVRYDASAPIISREDVTITLVRLDTPPPFDWVTYPLEVTEALRVGEHPEVQASRVLREGQQAVTYFYYPRQEFGILRPDAPVHHYEACDEASQALGTECKSLDELIAKTLNESG